VQELTFPPNWKQRPAPKRDGPERPFYITVNEINSYKRCRRAWDITSANRMGLSHKGTPTPALHIGSAFHYALAVQSLGGDPLEAIRDFFYFSMERLQDRYLAEVGTYLGPEELAELEEERLLCLSLIKAYFDRYGTTNPIKPYRMLAPEVTFCIPLFEEYPIFLIGTIDAVALDEQRCPVPIETKTYSRRPKRENWRFNHQLYGYAAALQILTKRRVAYGLYNGINKKSPTTPRILKDGSVSRAWIDTTYDLYREAVVQVHGSVPNHYLDILNRLKARDMSPENAFFTRFRIPILQHALERWWSNAQIIALEAAHYPAIYPNFEWSGCPMCRVKDLCHAIEAGEDTQYLIATGYTKSMTPTVRAIHDKDRPIAVPGSIKKPSDFVQYGHVSLDYDPDPVTEVAPSGD
jgi:PD-(D/E)XK nuclease superfamily protein